MNTGIIVQARMGSTRLPGKVLKEVQGRPLLSYQLERLIKANGHLLLATSTKERDDPIEALCQREGIPCFRGSEEDVLGRYLMAALAYKFDPIVRITADCPLIDPKVIDRVIAHYHIHDVAYVSNVHPRTYPKGMDVEVFAFGALEEAAKKATEPYDREHVTPYIISHFPIGNVMTEPSRAELSWVVDTQEDFRKIAKMLELIYPENPDFTYEDLLNHVF